MASSSQKSRWSRVNWALVPAAFLLALDGSHAGPSPTVQPSPLGGAPSELPVPLASPTGARLTAVERGSLIIEFQRAQRSEMKALEHRHKMELKELKASQDMQMKDFLKTQTEALHKFVDEHPKGVERRPFVKDLIARRDALRALLADERIKRTRDQDVRRASLKHDQEVHLKEFKEALSRGERPDLKLWPQPGN